MQKKLINKFKGLSSYQLKLIALVTMTIDHLGAFKVLTSPVSCAVGTGLFVAFTNLLFDNSN